MHHNVCLHRCYMLAGFLALASKPAIGQPSVIGDWGAPIELNIDLKPAHMAVLKTGNVLFASGGFPPESQVALFDPDTELLTSLVSPVDQQGFEFNIFCSGHAQLADGRVVFFGGNTGYDAAHDHAVIYDPLASTNYWTLLDDMPPDGSDGIGPLGRRWYPSAVTMGDGRVLVLSGGRSNSPTPADGPILLNPNASFGQQWTELVATNPDVDLLYPWYPMAHFIYDGSVLTVGTNYFHAAEECPTDCPLYQQYLRGRLEVGTAIWSDLVTDEDPEGGPVTIKGGSSVQYHPYKIMFAGGSLEDEGGGNCSGDVVTDRVQHFNLFLSPLAPSDLAPMNYRRFNFYLVVLPTGKVLAVGGDGGNITTGVADCTNPVYQAEMYDPAANTWALMDSMTEPRMYHSAAVLLPDGRVLMGGGDCRPAECPGHEEPLCCMHSGCSGGGEACSPLDFQFTVEFYSPPYMFLLPRPAITVAPAEIYYGKAFEITTSDAPTITKVSLIRLGSATHSVNFDQRFMNLNFIFKQGSPDKLIIAAPPSWNVAPPGYYMLFILRGESPSEAAIVKVKTDLQP